MQSVGRLPERCLYVRGSVLTVARYPKTGAKLRTIFDNRNS
jgi:hypothetical protein